MKLYLLQKWEREELDSEAKLKIIGIYTSFKKAEEKSKEIFSSSIKEVDSDCLFKICE